MCMHAATGVHQSARTHIYCFFSAWSIRKIWLHKYNFFLSLMKTPPTQCERVHLAISVETEAKAWRIKGFGQSVPSDTYSIVQMAYPASDEFWRRKYLKSRMNVRPTTLRRAAFPLNSTRFEHITTYVMSQPPTDRTITINGCVGVEATITSDLYENFSFFSLCWYTCFKYVYTGQPRRPASRAKIVKMRLYGPNPSDSNSRPFEWSPTWGGRSKKNILEKVACFLLIFYYFFRICVYRCLEI